MMGFFHSNEEPVVAYDYSDEFPDDCMVSAVQDLTNDPDWHPEEVVQHVKRHRGLLTNAFDLITKYAPVTSHEHAEVTAHRRTGGITIDSENGCTNLRASDELVVTYDTSPGRAHAECIRADEFDYYAQTHHIRHIYTKKS